MGLESRVQVISPSGLALWGKWCVAFAPMTIVVQGVKCAHKCGNGVRLLQVWNLREQSAALELSITVAAILAWLQIVTQE